MSERREVTHAPDPAQGLFGQGALCSTPMEEGRVLRMTQVRSDVDCAVCLDLLGEERCGDVVVLWPDVGAIDYSCDLPAGHDGRHACDEGTWAADADSFEEAR